MMQVKNKEYLRSVLFGIEDSLVSTTGLIAGISVGSQNAKFVLLAGTVAICIEALSMGVSEFLSDDAVQELDKLKRHRDNPLLSGLFMLISYFLAGIVPLSPIFFTSYPLSLFLSVVMALICLFLLGYIKGRLLNIPPLKGAFKFLVIGGITTIIGIIVGMAFKI